jgi:RNA polymerase sigma-70 factor, ECF subfamily
MIRALIYRLMGPKPEPSNKLGIQNAGEVTLLLRRWSDGEADAKGELFSLLYPELKRIAETRLRPERPDHTLQPTALVSEFFLRLAKHSTLTWRNRAHFLAVASQAMRRSLIDYARARKADKRGGGALLLRIDDLSIASRSGGLDALEFNDLLEKMALEEPRMAQVAELRCFGGLTHEEIGETLGIDERTVKRDWEVAGAWLRGHLRKGRTDVGRRVGTD